MTPRSLLFSSDQETARVLSQALNELEIDVEHCTEVFTALKRVTTYSFDLVVVDCDEGLEAGFLLKTSRELKANHSAFAVVMARGDARAIARQSGANLVLAKPILLEKVQFALLGSDEFLRRLKSWLPPRNVRGTTLMVNEKGMEFVPSAQPRPVKMIAGTAVTLPPVAQTRAASHASANLTFASLEGPSVSESLLKKVLQVNAIKRISRHGIGKRESALLRRAAIVVVFFAVGYVCSQPFSRVGANVAKMYHSSWDGKPTAQAAVPNSQIAEASEAPLESETPEPRHSRHNSSTRIRVVPVSDPWNSQPRPASKTAEHLETTAQLVPEPTSSAAISAKPPVPESLSSPSPEAASVRSGAADSLLGALEPVVLPEYLSEKLLLDKVQPSYPEQALRAGLRGPVVLQALIGKDGKIADLKLIRGSILLGEAASQAVKQWRYKPYLLNGEAVAAQTYVTVDFRLP